MIRFANIEFLYALLLIPIFVLIYWYAMKKKKRALIDFGELHLIDRLIPDSPKYKYAVKFLLLISALVFTIFGLANLQDRKSVV